MMRVVTILLCCMAFSIRDGGCASSRKHAGFVSFYKEEINLGELIICNLIIEYPIYIHSSICRH